MSCKDKREITGPLPGLMDTLSPNGAVRGNVARVIFNYVGGRRFGGLRIYGRADSANFLNNDLHDQLLGAVGSGGYITPSGPPVFIVQPRPTNAPIHGSAVLWVVVTGLMPITYQWFMNEDEEEGVAVPGATSSSLVISDIVEPKNYWCVATNSEGSAESDHVQVTSASLEDIMNYYRANFETIADMLASDATKWLTAEVRNYFPGDGILSIWNVTQSEDVLPNGTDILQTVSPQITVYRTYERESDIGTVLPGLDLAPYVASKPLVFPTSDDFRNSLVTAPFAIVLSPRKLFFEQGDLTGPADDVNNVVNAAGTTYRRWRPE